MPKGIVPSPKGKAGVRPRASASSRSRTTEALPDGSDLDAIALLEQDHREVDRLFVEFETAPSHGAKRKIANTLCTALKVHARIEEDLFYPAAYSPDSAALLAEARVEHASARDLIAQIEASGPGEALYDARMKVLAEYVRHHVAEEEGEIFPLCRKNGVDLAALGRELAAMKRELMRGATVSNPILAIPA